MKVMSLPTDTITECPVGFSGNTTDNLTRLQHASAESSSSFNIASYAVNTTYVIIGVFGIVGNFVALLVIGTHKPLRNRLSNYYFINQIVVDFLVCSLLIPSIVPNYGYTNLLFCLFWQSRVFFLSLYLTSSYSIVAMAIERYMEIVHPIKHRVSVTKRKVYLTIVAVWVIGFGQKMAYMMASTRPVDGVCILSYWFPNFAASVLAGIFNWIVEYFIPITVIAFCYVRMLRALRSKVQPWSVTVSGNQFTPPNNKSRACKNIFATLIIIVVSFLVCNTLKQTLLLVKYTGVYPVSITSTIFNISQIIAFVNATIEPYIYFLQHREFKTGLRNLICKKKISGQSSDDYTSYAKPPTVLTVQSTGLAAIY